MPSPSKSSSHVLSINLLSSKPLSGELLSANLLSSEFLHLFSESGTEDGEEARILLSAKGGGCEGAFSITVAGKAEVGEPAAEHIACGGAVFVFTVVEEAWDCWRACGAKIREPDASDGGTRTRGRRGREEGAWVGRVGQRPAITCVVRLSFCFLLLTVGSPDATRHHGGSHRPYSCLLHRPASSPQHQGYSHRKDFIFLRFTSFIDTICHLFFNLLWQETSSAQYILQQYIAASGGFKLLSSIRNTYSIGKVRMVATEFETATRITKNRNPTRNAESGGFVLWCISQLPLGRLRKCLI
ncbi:hypothetical protein ZIOFF_060290 [Zingiber officinale]|uniref:Uncharacterized protein n=1 Tax=Zingiber officinale TaxID=94328 RepID=A0A8J5FCH3_ZINOF|nr:hypothetical protein ZIOFF_060290 [Zingiber officinale]